MNITPQQVRDHAFPAKLIIERGLVRTENSNKPHGFGVLNPQTFTPFPKNPVIAAFFRQIGRADELGSGMRNLMKYGKTYGGADPEMIESDVFRIIVRVPAREGEAGAPQVGSRGVPESGAESGLTEVGEQVGAQSGAQSGKILSALADNPLSAQEIAQRLCTSSKSGAFKRCLKELLAGSLIAYTIPDKPNSRLQRYRLTATGKRLIRREGTGHTA